MSDIVYSQWFQNFQNPPQMGAYNNNNYYSSGGFTTLKRENAPQDLNGLLPATKRRKLDHSTGFEGAFTTGGGGVSSSVEEDESWMDELFMIGAGEENDYCDNNGQEANAEDTDADDIQPTDISNSTTADEVRSVVTCESSSSSSSSLYGEGGETPMPGFLSNVVGKVLSKLGKEDEGVLLGEFSRSFTDGETDEYLLNEFSRTFLQDETTTTTTNPAVSGYALNNKKEQQQLSTTREQQQQLPSSCSQPQPQILLQQEQRPQQLLLKPKPDPVLAVVSSKPPASVQRSTSPHGLSSSFLNVPIAVAPYGSLSSMSSMSSSSSDLDSTKFTIDTVKDCPSPMLLTLTSFPFRVIYANAAFQQMTGHSDIIGKTFYDIFVSEGKQAPSFGACSTLLGKFQDDNIVRVQAKKTNDQHNSSGSVYSSIKVRPIYKRSEAVESGLRYYAVTLKELDVSDGSSIVYLPMPSGSMVKF